MNIPDYEKMRATLLATDDQQVLRLVRVMDPVFRRPKFRPSAESAAAQSDIIAAACTLFPTPFARQFASWADDLEVELREALAACSGMTAEDTRPDGPSPRDRPPPNSHSQPAGLLLGEQLGGRRGIGRKVLRAILVALRPLDRLPQRRIGR
jgi:hypothetical protein